MKELFETFKLCGGKRCCPEVNIKGDTTTIKDDYGNCILIETEHLRLLGEKCKELFPEDN